MVWPRLDPALGHAGKLTHVCDAVQEPCPLASFQWDEILENIMQFPNESYTSDLSLTLESGGSPLEGFPPLFLLDLVTDPLNDFANPSAWGIDYSMCFVTPDHLLGQT